MMGIARSAVRDGGALEEEVFGSIYDHRVITRFIPHALPYKHLVAGATVAMIVFAGTQVAVPWIIKLGIDDVVGQRNLSGLAWVVALFFGNAVLNWVSNYAQEVTIAKAGQGVLMRLRGELFAHLQKLSLSFFDKTEVGRIMSRVQGDVYQLQEFLHIAVMTMGDFLSLTGIVVALLIMNLKLGLISMAVLPILILVMAFWQSFARKAFIRARRTIAIVNGALNENISGVRVVQSMNRQERNLEIFEEKNHENLDATLFASRLSAGLIPGVDILTALSIGLAIFFGSRLVSDGELEVGALIAFIMYIQRFFDPIRSLTMQYTQLQRAMASGVRIFQLLDTAPGIVDAPGAKDLPKLRGEVEFQNVTFGYLPGEDVLKDVSLHVSSGETVAVVGPTGAGKTTLVSLLGRFYDVERDQGAILVDGNDVRDWTRKSLASQTSMVLQEPFLFSGTVRENIKYNHTDVTDEQMIQASRAVGAHDFVMRLEDGYDTFLEERGLNLSVGQRQLLSFARAIVANPRILILDEATANIDSHTEMLIQRALQKLLVGRTAIVIAHRLSTIRGADKIIVLDRGQVVETGSHDHLMDNAGLYAHLYQMNYAALEEAVSAPADQVGDGGNPSVI